MPQKINEIINVSSITHSLSASSRVKRSLKLWQETQLPEIYHALLDYYQNLGNKLFSYPSRIGNITTPIYVQPEWQGLTEAHLRMAMQERIVTYQPSGMQLQFWNFYNQMKNNQLYDGRIFRLTNLETSDQTLNLNFEIGQFSHSVMCHYLLEHELIIALSNKASLHNSLAIRNQVAGDERLIITFFQNNVTRIGINNLILIRKDPDTYLALSRKKTMQSMIQHHLFDQISSCIFEIIDSPENDFNLQNTVLRETAEELFGQTDQTLTQNQLNKTNKNQELNELQRMLKNGSAAFQVTGFCIDLVRLVPEITTLLVVQDETFFKHFVGENTHLNDEFLPGLFFQIPCDLDDVDAFLKSEIVSDPDGDPSIKGFNPIHWTLPGGFSFYQGLKRAVDLKLLN